jgi:two-component system, NtrC family, nitrogen regulation response regulator GlnG
MEKSPLQIDIEAHLERYFMAHEPPRLPPPGLYNRFMALAERPLIEMTLAATGGNQLKAAELLGINRNTLRKRMTELGIGK